MQNTIFNTPVVKHIIRAISIVLMKLLGWKTSGVFPDEPKYVIIVAHHTSNWDMLYGMIAAFKEKADVYYLAKHQLFRFPMGCLMRWAGGIRLDRRTRGDTVESTIDMFRKHDRLAIAMSPEGTRSKRDSWKTGFYYIAEGAGVPILLGFLDYRTKTAGLGPLIYPSGDIEKDFGLIRDFYSGITARRPENASLISLP